jgi:hypothetical protein
LYWSQGSRSLDGGASIAHALDAGVECFKLLQEAFNNGREIEIRILARPHGLLFSTITTSVGRRIRAEDQGS